MAGFTKLVPEIVQSSIWNEPSDIRIVWITMLAVKDQDGYVRGDAKTIARLANVPLESCQAALEMFQQPDPSSHTPDNDGKRIAPAAGGWQILNHGKYRNESNPAHLKEAGYVYFAYSQTTHRVKIGYSANPWSRINELRCGVPDLELLGALHGKTIADERALHERFKAFNVGREWFAYNQEIRDYIESVVTTKATTSSTTPSASASASISASKSGSNRVQGEPPPPDRWTVEQFAAAAKPAGVTEADARACWAHYSTQGWVLGNGRDIALTATPATLLARWSSKQGGGKPTVDAAPDAPAAGKPRARWQIKQDMDALRERIGKLALGSPSSYASSEQWDDWRKTESGKRHGTMKAELKKLQTAFDNAPD